MISLFKLHFYYLFSWKTIYITLGLVVVSIISFLIFSKFYLDVDLLLFDSEYYKNQYYFESLNYIKLNIIIYNMFLVINGFSLNKYDLFLLVRRSKKQVITSKIIVLLLGNGVLITFFYSLFLIIGLFLTPYMNVTKNDLMIFFDLVIFGGVYLLIFIVVYLHSGSIYSLLIVIIGFFISDLTVDYNALRSNASTIVKVINLVFVSIGNYQEIGYSLFYGKIYGIILLELLFIIVFLKYLQSDF